MAVTLSGVTVANSSVQQAGSDPYFPNVLCMMPGVGTNGGNNNTFVDSSGNGYTVTRNGDTTQGSFSPYLSNWSFDSIGSSVTVNDNAALRPGTGAFTLEAWVFRRATGATFTIYSKTFVLSITTTNVLRFTDGVVTIDSTGTIDARNWFHVAVVREGTGTNQTKLYINGVNDGQGTSSVNLNQTSNVTIGGYSGMMSNLRYANNALYLANFTPSKVPLTAVSGTQLLTFQNNRTIDNSPNNFTIIRASGGGAQFETAISTFSPFPPPAPYDVVTAIGAGYFDGSGDYLTVADTAALRFGTGNFTIQAWIWVTSWNVVRSIASKGTSTTGWTFDVESVGFGTFRLRFTDGTTVTQTSQTIRMYEWYHVAVVRSGTGTDQLKLYINGVESASGTCSTDFNQTDQLNIGASRTNATTLQGYISNFKYNVGTAETITVPTSPVTGGTLLLNFANAQVVDATGISNYLTPVSTISNVQAKWKPTSLYNSGSSTNSTFQNLDNNSIFGGVTDAGKVYTIECWIFPISNGRRPGIAGKYRGDTNVGWYFEITTGGDLNIRSTTYTLSTKFTFGAWQHFAFVNDGTNLTVYLNGQSVWTLACFTISDGATSSFYIGGGESAGGSGQEYIQDFRFTVGVARYAANFTPPTAPLPRS